MLGDNWMIRAVLLDLDGTVYNGTELISGSDVAIGNMRKQGIKVLFCTNNSSNMPITIAKKLIKMGIDCKEEDIISSGYLSLQYSIKNGLKNIFIIGSKELKDSYINSGLTLTDEEHAETLIIGMDSEFNYEKLTRGLRAAVTAKTIILCNQDRSYYKENGLFPGCGGMTSSILYCSNKKPDYIVGKPNTHILEHVQEKYGYSKEEMIVVGDSRDSDIAMAESFGCKSIIISSKTTQTRSITGLIDTINWDWAEL